MRRPVPPALRPMSCSQLEFLCSLQRTRVRELGTVITRDRVGCGTADAHVLCMPTSGCMRACEIVSPCGWTVEAGVVGSERQARM